MDLDENYILWHIHFLYVEPIFLEIW